MSHSARDIKAGAISGGGLPERVAFVDDSFSWFSQTPGQLWWGCRGYDWLSEGLIPGSGHTPPRLIPTAPYRFCGAFRPRGCAVHLLRDGGGGHGLIEIFVGTTRTGPEENLDGPAGDGARKSEGVETSEGAACG